MDRSSFVQRATFPASSTAHRISPVPQLSVVQPALIGVLQTSSERDHNSDAGTESFDRLPLPWVAFEYFDEHSVEQFLTGICARRFASICFASNSLWNPVNFEAVHRVGADVADACQGGMGIIVLQQFLPEGRSRQLTFLPGLHGLEYRGRGYQRFPPLRVPRPARDGTTILLNEAAFGSREMVLWSTLHALHERAWCPELSVQVEGASKLALARTLAAQGRVIASALPLDWMADHRLLTHVVALSTRPSGTLYVHPPGAVATDSIALELRLGRAVAEGGHLSTLEVTDPGQITSRSRPYEDFSHLVIGEAWGWPDLSGLIAKRIRGRLENGGSITAFASARTEGGERVLAVLHGRPTYLRLADRFAAWFERNRERFLDAPATQVRALAVAAATIYEKTVDKDEVPRALAVHELDRVFNDYFESRLNGADNVDGHVLPTASVASAMLLLGRPAADVAPMIAWINKGHYVSSHAAVQQAALWLDGVEPPSEGVVSSRLETIYAHLIALKTSPQDSSIDELIALLEDDGENLGRRAIVAQTLASHGGPVALGRAAGAARMLQNDLDHGLSADHAPLEVMCLLTAFLVTIYAGQEFVAGGL